MSPSPSSSSNAAELLSRFCDQQVKHDGPHVEVGTVKGACFVYHLTGCKQCSTYVEHLLEDVAQCSTKFSFSRDEILDCINDAWSHVGAFITKMGDEHNSFEDELFQERSDNRRLQGEIDDLQEKIQTLETQLASLHIHNTSSEHSLMLISPIDAVSSIVNPHPLASPEKWTYSGKRARKLDKSSSFRNKVLKPDERLNHWSLHMWNILEGWYTNPMSVPNAVRDDYKGYFLKEDLDVTVWLSKIAADLPQPAFLHRMKAVDNGLINPIKGWIPNKKGT
ncbi:hypothetical protein M422DRAFT_271382 [Sphaerobolus stellatus SS14]|uniref:Uncharacterized protein n=1 Tax=Sphaerobolus stellatus (strain SS14) TaxID=990650 RepID=A0A0C9UPU0_SPHS4|nr:hypothetical protein M422DRAFT_271382 [Sphaerobolus stellatus SS14]